MKVHWYNILISSTTVTVFCDEATTLEISLKNIVYFKSIGYVALYKHDKPISF